MRHKIVILLTILCLGFIPAGVAQKKSPRDEVHPAITKVKNDLSKSVSLQGTLKEMYEAVEMASTDAEKIDHYFWISRQYASVLKIDSSLLISDKMKAMSEKIAYEKGVGKSFLARAHALSFRNKRDEELLNKAHIIFSAAKDNFFLGLNYRERGRESDLDGKFREAKLNFHAAIFHLAQTSDQRELQRAYYELGKSFYQTYEVDSTAHYLVISLRMAEKLNEPNKIFNSAGMLGQLYLVADDMDNAARYFKYALDTRTPQISKVSSRNYVAGYAASLIVKGDHAAASEAIKEYETLSIKLGDVWGMVILDKLKGMQAFHQQNYRGALQYFRKAFDRRGEISSFTADIKNIGFYLARAEYETGDYANAIRHFSYVMDLAKELQYGLELMESNLLVAESYSKLKQPDSAYYFFRVYDRMKDSLLVTQREKTFIELTTKYDAERREQQIKLLQKEKDLFGVQLRLKNAQIEKQTLLDARRRQELALLSQQNQISRLEATRNSLAIENQQREIDKKKNELALLYKENQLQAAITATEKQRKNFAYIGIAGILLFSGYVYYRSVRNKKLSRQLATSLVELKDAQEQLIKAEKEKEAQSLRVRISRDIHDEVGATLSGVALFSEIAKQKMEQRQPQEVQQYLEHISINSKEMVEKMSDIVWAINPQNDSFDRIITKLESYAVNVCAGKGIRLHLDVDSSVRSYYPGMQVRKNIYMLVKEAINNAVKYSNSRNIYFSLRNPNGNMVVEIRDDGQGFDTRMIRKGNGLNNMEARAAELKAVFNVQSGEGKGTSVSLEFNFHPVGGQLEAV
jgi:signal transduction histidine kinase